MLLNHAVVLTFCGCLFWFKSIELCQLCLPLLFVEIVYSSPVWNSHNDHFDYSATTMRYPCFRIFHISKAGFGIVNVLIDLSVCCAHEGKTDTNWRELCCFLFCVSFSFLSSSFFLLKCFIWWWGEWWSCWWWSLLYRAILRSLEQTHCARMWFYMSD